MGLYSSAHGAWVRPSPSGSVFREPAHRFVFSLQELIMNFIKQFIRDEEGVTAIEYSLIAAIIAVGLITILGTVKTSLVGIYQAIATALDNAI
jgi:pilus assembly protein Flp/PilA